MLAIATAVLYILSIAINLTLVAWVFFVGIPRVRRDIRAIQASTARNREETARIRAETAMLQKAREVTELVA